jgi:hypothetical protein
VFCIHENLSPFDNQSTPDLPFNGAGVTATLHTTVYGSYSTTFITQSTKYLSKAERQDLIFGAFGVHQRQP